MRLLARHPTGRCWSDPPTRNGPRRCDDGAGFLPSSNERRLRHHVVQVRPAARLDSVRDVELAEDVPEVELHRLLGEPQHSGHLGIRSTFRDEPEDLELSLREQPGIVVLTTTAWRKLLGRSAARSRKVDRPAERLADCNEQVVGSRGPQAVRICTSAKSCIDRGFVAGRRHDDDSQIRTGDAERAQLRRVPRFRHALVDADDEQGRLVLMDESCCVLERGRARDRRDACMVEHTLKPFEPEPMAVDDDACPFDSPVHRTTLSGYLAALLSSLVGWPAARIRVQPEVGVGVSRTSHSAMNRPLSLPIHLPR